MEALWNAYKSVIPRVGESFVPGKDILVNTEKLIKKFNLVDPNSMCFRYPVDRSTDRIQV